MARSVRVQAPGRLPALVERVRNYLNEVWIELNRVDWPTRRELISSTIVVIVVLLVLAVYLGLFDYIYTVLIKRYLIPPRA
jgi:preprotein translocase subunit SecE